MKTCETCKHWVWNESDLPWSLDDPETNERVRLQPYADWEIDDEPTDKVLAPGQLKMCGHPSVTFFSMPPPGGATVCDGSEFRACLLTRPDFGCTLHEEK